VLDSDAEGLPEDAEGLPEPPPHAASMKPAPITPATAT
jgi:hypothetical protein